MPLFDLLVQNAPLEAELKESFERVLHSSQFILGDEVEQFEARMSQTLEVKHAIGVSSGTDALLLALMTLGIGPGDEVLCPAFTFFATAGSIARVGATPVFCDVCPVCFNLNPHDAEKRITKNTKAIIPVHLFGQAAAMDPLLDLARAHNLRVIEDCAQALGATYKDRPVGTMGDFAAHSFFPTKNLGGFGDGGLLATNDDDLAAEARTRRVHGARNKNHHEVLGGNFRLDAMQAALLSVKLPHLDAHIASRRTAAEGCAAVLGSGMALETDRGPCCSSTAFFGMDPTVPMLPVESRDRCHTWNLYTLRLPVSRRNALATRLRAENIQTGIYYPEPLHRQPCFNTARSKLPIAEHLVDQVLSLPLSLDDTFPARVRLCLMESVGANLTST